MIRVFLIVFLVLFAALVGFGAGAFISATFLVAPGAGLAGATEAVVTGTVVGLVSGLIAAFLLPRLTARTLARLAMGVAILLIVLIGLRVWNDRQESEAATPAPSRTVTEIPSEASR
ncbi:MAG: hypothetical protein DHS20C06_04650 [Hyphobacterium sp.]|nr:MAG: hypothetical protein DHS20C06_04650 [Hyphobacterium sp.]